MAVGVDLMQVLLNPMIRQRGWINAARGTGYVLRRTPLRRQTPHFSPVVGSLKAPRFMAGKPEVPGFDPDKMYLVLTSTKAVWKKQKDAGNDKKAISLNH